MYYLVYVTDDADCKAVYGPATTEEHAVDKLTDYVEVGLVSGIKRVLTRTEKEYIASHKTFIVDAEGSAWYIVRGSGLL
jgi:hypothetical protein